MMTTNNQIETAFAHDSTELSLEGLAKVTGGGQVANAIAYAAGNAIGVTLYVGVKVAAALHRIIT